MYGLENLRKGKKVIVGGAYIDCRICTVEKVTKKFIFVEGTKYCRIYGWMPGYSSYSSNYIRPATEEDIKRVEEETEKRKIIRYISDTKRLSLNTLTAIRDMIEKELGDSAE